MPPRVTGAARPRQVRVLEQAAARPLSHHLDTVDRAAEVLVVALDDAHIAANEDELLGPLFLVGEHLADALLHALLHLIVPLGRRLALELLHQPVARPLVAALVRPQQRRAREEVRRLDAPLFGDALDRLIVERHEGLPEDTVLVPEPVRHVHVQPVVDEHELGAAVGQPPDKDITRVRVAVDDAPLEDLGGEEVDHGRHDLLARQAQAAAAASALPLGSFRLDLLGVRPLAELAADGGHVRGLQARALDAGGSVAVAAHPAPVDALLVPQPDALDPLRHHDAPRRQLRVDLGHVDPAAQALLRLYELAHRLRVLGLIQKVRLELQPLRDKGHEAVQRQIEPFAVDPGDRLERPQIPADLLGDLALLDLDGHLAAVREAGPVHLRDAGTRPGAPLHDALALLAAEADAEDLFDAPAPKILADDGFNVAPVVLRGVVKHAREHLLELGRQNSALHGDGLADLEIQPAVVSQQLEQALGVTVVQVLDGAAGQWFRAEVDLVVEGDHEAHAEGAEGTAEPGGVDLTVEEVDGAADGGEDEEPAQPFAPAGLCCDVT
ncbi:hypothetical protein ColKHC_06028 [Colletotrichum higginsianum]|nr:hypothetical protein ColKHC_06028 [Colletotrichum higginsianum]